MRILTLLALGITLSAGAAQAHLAQWCMGRVSLESLPLDPRSVSDAQRPWTYAGVFRNHAPTPFRIVVSFVGPPGVTSLANGREVTLEPDRETQIFLVQWPKSMAQPSLNTLASATRMICYG